MYIFDAKRATENLIQWIKDWFEENGKGCNAVLGISGGKDSTVAAALCVEALGKDRVIGVLLPNGMQADIGDAMAVCETLGIKKHTINIKEAVDATYRELKRNGIHISEQTKINTPPRERTKVIRAICQSENGRMVNTCNLSEDYTGYFTIGGDGDGDFAPLGNLTATEVIAVGHYLGLPDALVDKAPSDGLSGKTDEDSFGFTYEVLDKYIRTGICEDGNMKEKIDRRHGANEFKLEPIQKGINW